MAQSPADRLISRITALHKSLQLDDGGKLSTMERDLMLGYLREIYEIYATHQEGKPYTPPPAPSPPPVRPQPIAAPAPRPAPAPAVVPTPAPPVAPVVTPPPPVAPTPPQVVVAPPPPTPQPVTPQPATPQPASGDLRALFVDDATAGRFGRQSLADLTRALTINNRVLFSRDLFGDDNDLLNTSMRTLNIAGSFSVAQPTLESIASRFNWTEEDKIETAKEFIELVRRRYA
jgi:hypothetical protein